MILDSSAVVGLLLKEPDHYRRLIRVVSEADLLGIGTPTLVESCIVLTARAGPPGRHALDRFALDNEISIIPFTTAHWRLAASAFQRYGKGRHPARLNLGDCFSYATAELAGRPLLCVGDDFAQTELPLVPLGG